MHLEWARNLTLFQVNLNAFMISYELGMSLEYTRKKMVKLWLYSEYSECTRNTLGILGMNSEYTRNCGGV